MKIIIATDSYKGSLSSIEAAQAMQKGLMRVWPDAEYVSVTVADGGEGTAVAMAEGASGKMLTETVTGPDGKPTEASFALLPGGMAVIEMAEAAGLPLMKGRLDPMNATTYGVGELMLAAVKHGARCLYVGLGGSATSDAGAGWMQAIGVKLLDENGKDLPFGGGALDRIHTVDPSGIDKRLEGCEIRLMSDVDCPLCGPGGAAAIFGPQKGASPEQVEILNENHLKFSAAAEAAFNKKASSLPGAGAAGGLGFGLLVSTGATIRPGIEEILDVCGFDKHLSGADLVVTGEGSMDYQSARGKTPVGVARRAMKHGIPAVAIAGSIGKGISEVYDAGISAVFSAVTRPMQLDEALANAAEFVENAAERAAKALSVGLPNCK